MYLPSLPFTEQFWSAPDGTRIRYAWLSATSAVKGTVLILQGRREFIEKYAELTSEWRAKGYHVGLLDWRGQGGSGRMLENSHKSHVISFDDYRNDLDKLYQLFFKLNQEGPLIVLGYSMGGFIALDWLLKNKPPVSALILVAPMLVLPVPGWLNEATHLVAKSACTLGYATSYIPGEQDYIPHQHPFENNLLTSDFSRYSLITTYFAEKPHLAIGGVTYGWLDAAMRGLDSLHKRLNQVATPCLTLCGGQDKVIPHTELKRWIPTIPNVIEKIYPQARHDILSETDDIRQAVWQDIDEFLTKTTA